MSQLLYGVYGASGCGRGIMPLARQQLQSQQLPQSRLVFIDDHASGECNGHAVLSYAQFLQTPANQRNVVIAIANSRVRHMLSVQCAADHIQPWTVITDNAVIMDSVSLGPGAVISPFVTLTSNIQIGQHFHANLYSYVEHDCIIGDFVTFAPGVKCNGNVHIHDHAYIGAGAMLRQGQHGQPLIIGVGATVGMGAVVTKDVAPGTTVVGNPARVLLK